jgi:tRNA (cmo5U34)-methyltransferase
MQSYEMTDAPKTFDEHAADYNAARRRLIPPFEAFYSTATSALRLADGVERVLDLGAGTGLLSYSLRASYPDAHLVLLDGAPAMLEQARELLGEQNTEYVLGDLGDPLPAGPWDAIVSGLAIHHLDHDGKRRLFARIHDQLRAGGVFVNAEQVAGPTTRLTDHYLRWHEEQARRAGSDDAEWSGALERMAHDVCASVEEQLRWLGDAGFTDVDCLFRDHRFAVMVAMR